MSDLEPKEARATSFFGSTERFALGKDRNVLGGPLVVRGREFPKGLGTRSQSRIEFDLGGAYRRFQATAALDDLSQGKGSVRFVVEKDGTRIFESGLVTGTSAPRGDRAARRDGRTAVGPDCRLRRTGRH